MPDLTPNYEASRDFLQRFRPNGPWVLTAIKPDRKSIVVQTFLRTNVADMMAWLAEKGSTYNLYFSVNPTTRPMQRKCEKGDVKEVAWLHVDLDQHEGESLEASRSRNLALLTSNLPAGVPPPTCVVDSGGGFWGFWRLEEPVEVGGDVAKAEDAERYNLQLESLFAADHCHNVDRIARLPGTINWPNEKKVAKGRQPAPASVVSWADHAYPVSAFLKAPKVQTSTSAAGSTVTISGNLPRLSLGDLPKGLPELCRVVIAQGFDPDDPQRWPSRSEALMFVMCELIRHGCTDDQVYSVVTDPEYGISASILDKSRPHEEAVRQISRARERAVHPKLAEFNEKHAVIRSINGRCRVICEEFEAVLERSRVSFQTFGDFRNAYLNDFMEIPDGDKVKMVAAADWWLHHRHRRQYDTLGFAPGREVSGMYNLWRGFSVEAKPGKGHESFLRHILDNICSGNEELYRYVVRWMALGCQHPAQPGHVALVLRGRQGTGKGQFANHYGRLWGRHFLPVRDAAHLVGQFNAHLRDCVVLFADEAFFAGDKKHQSMLKTIVTEELVTIEAKGIDAEAAPNYVHLIMASNERWVVPADVDERRFCVIDVAPSKMQDKTYFKTIANDLKAGGYENLLHFLLTLDLEGFEVRDFPRTKALQEQKVLSMTAEEEWWFRKLVDGEVIPGCGWPQYVFATELSYNFIEYAKAWGMSTRSNVTRLGNFLRSVCPDGWKLRGQLRTSREVVQEDGEKVRVDRPRVYFVPPLDQARAHWAKFCGGAPADGWPVIEPDELEMKEPSAAEDLFG